MEEIANLLGLRFRFSIRSIFIAMVLLGLTIVVAQLWREVGPLRDEVQRLRVETGRLTVKIPNNVYGFPIATHDQEARR